MDYLQYIGEYGYIGWVNNEVLNLVINGLPSILSHCKAIFEKDKF